MKSVSLEVAAQSTLAKVARAIRPSAWVLPLLNDPVMVPSCDKKFTSEPLLAPF